MLRQFLISGVLIVCVAAVAAGCAPLSAAAPSAGQPVATTTFTVYTRVTDVTRTVEMDLISAFEAKHRVKVNLVSADDPDLFARFMAEVKNGLPTGEVFAGWNPVGTLELQHQGGLEAYVPPALAARIPERLRSPVVIQHAGLSTLAYNPAKLGDIPVPTSYADLARPIYKDKLEMTDPIVSSSALKLVGYLAYSTPLGWDYWTQLHANGIRFVGDPSQVLKDIENPAAPAAIGIVGYGRAYPDQQAGKAVKVVIPSEGLIAGEYVVAVATHAAHPDLARAFVDEVTFNPKLLDAWAKQYLPVTVEGVAAPPGTPPLDKIVITDSKQLQEKELEIRTRWQTILSQ